jgi:amino acid transporter
MFIADLFAALVFGVVIVFILSALFGTKGPWGSLLWFFMVVVLFSWAGGVWLRPYGPIYMGVGWLPIILVGVFIAILLTAVSPRNPRYRFASRKQLKADEERKTSADAFFWVLIFCLVLLAMSHYYWYPQLG